MVINTAMLAKNSKQILVILFIFLTVAACQNEQRKHVDSGAEKPDLNFSRFEKDLFAFQPAISENNLQQLRMKYGSFVDLYAQQVIGIKTEHDSSLGVELSKFINDPYIAEVYQATQQMYENTTWMKSELEEVFRYYHYYFPDKNIPRVLTFIAPFNYNMLAADSILAIGLDMYLGSDYKYYPSAGFPLYKIKKLRKEYITVDAISAWLQSDYELDISHNDLLNNMVHEGKIIYATSMLLPDLPDTLLLGFSASQLNWCKKNEEHIWKFFIEQKLLFNKNPGEFVKFINDGVSTSGFPAEAPAKIGCYIGWRIVDSFMEKNSKVKLEQLMNIKDGNKILIESNYKPQKNS